MSRRRSDRRAVEVCGPFLVLPNGAIEEWKKWSEAEMIAKTSEMNVKAEKTLADALRVAVPCNGEVYDLGTQGWFLWKNL